MINGVPSLLFYDMADKSFVPTMSVLQQEISKLKNF